MRMPAADAVFRLYKSLFMIVSTSAGSHCFSRRVKNGRMKKTSGEPRLTANITVNMFYYQTSVQDASATPGPCSRTAHRHTLLGTHWHTCGVRTSRSLSLTRGPRTARTWIQSHTL